MRILQVKIINKLGLHARASAKFVATAAKYQSSIEIIKNKQTINGKSIMGVMMLAATQNTVLELHINGPDEEMMEQALVNLIQRRFDEDE